MIPYGRQNISEEDIQAVVQVLKSDFLTQGPVVPNFEQVLCEYTGATNAVVTNSATSALHLACRALGLGDGDLLWTSPITFVASANCALYCNAAVDFVDIDPDTFNISIDALKLKLEKAEKKGNLPKILIPVHLCGLSCDMQAIGALSKTYGFSIIEDASHAIGGKYHGEPVGNCRYSDITVFSFHPVKIITTGEGGAALTNNPFLAERMSLLRSHGITHDPEHMTHEPDGEWYYQQIELGYNYRMTDMQAALGLSQMGRLTEFVSQRNDLAKYYEQQFDQLPIKSQEIANDIYSSMHLYVVRVPAVRHKKIFEKMRNLGVGVNLHYIPVHLQPVYRLRGFKEEQFKQAENYYKEAISLPIYLNLTQEKQEKVIDALKVALQ